MMKSKFDFYEVVRIHSNDIKHQQFNGHLGIIRGKVQNEKTGKWIYGVSIHEKNYESIHRFYECHLQKTGQKTNPKDYESGEVVKIRVDPKTGEGEIIEEDE